MCLKFEVTLTFWVYYFLLKIEISVHETLYLRLNFFSQKLCFQIMYEL